MAFIVPSMTNPLDPSGAPLTNVYAKVNVLNMDIGSKSGRIELAFYKNSTAQAAGAIPVAPSIGWAISSVPRLIDPVEYEEDGVTVKRAATYFPSFDQLEAGCVTLSGDAAGTKAYDIVKRNLYALLATFKVCSGFTPD